MVPDAGSPTTLLTDTVLKNLVMFGSVNANRRHYFLAARALPRAPKAAPPGPVAWAAAAEESEVLPMPAEQADEIGIFHVLQILPSRLYTASVSSPSPASRSVLEAITRAETAASKASSLRLASGGQPRRARYWRSI